MYKVKSVDWPGVIGFWAKLPVTPKGKLSGGKERKIWPV
jgi:hypothetical protein